MFKRIKNYLKERRKRKFILKSYYAYLKNPVTINSVSALHYAIDDYNHYIKFVKKPSKEESQG